MTSYRLPYKPLVDLPQHLTARPLFDEECTQTQRPAPTQVICPIIEPTQVNQALPCLEPGLEVCAVPPHDVSPDQQGVQVQEARLPAAIDLECGGSPARPDAEPCTPSAATTACSPCSAPPAKHTSHQPDSPGTTSPPFRDALDGLGTNLHIRTFKSPNQPGLCPSVPHATTGLHSPTNSTGTRKRKTIDELPAGGLRAKTCPGIIVYGPNDTAEVMQGYLKMGGSQEMVGSRVASPTSPLPPASLEADTDMAAVRQPVDAAALELYNSNCALSQASPPEAERASEDQGRPGAAHTFAALFRRAGVVAGPEHAEDGVQGPWVAPLGLEESAGGGEVSHGPAPSHASLVFHTTALRLEDSQAAPCDAAVPDDLGRCASGLADAPQLAAVSSPAGAGQAGLLPDGRITQHITGSQLSPALPSQADVYALVGGGLPAGLVEAVAAALEARMEAVIQTRVQAAVQAAVQQLEQEVCNSTKVKLGSKAGCVKPRVTTSSLAAQAARLQAQLATVRKQIRQRSAAKRTVQHGSQSMDVQGCAPDSTGVEQHTQDMGTQEQAQPVCVPGPSPGYSMSASVVLKRGDAGCGVLSMVAGTLDTLARNPPGDSAVAPPVRCAVLGEHDGHDGGVCLPVHHLHGAADVAQAAAAGSLPVQQQQQQQQPMFSNLTCHLGSVHIGDVDMLSAPGAAPDAHGVEHAGGARQADLLVAGESGGGAAAGPALDASQELLDAAAEVLGWHAAHRRGAITPCNSTCSTEGGSWAASPCGSPRAPPCMILGSPVNGLLDKQPACDVTSGAGLQWRAGGKPAQQVSRQHPAYQGHTTRTGSAPGSAAHQSPGGCVSKALFTGADTSPVRELSFSPARPGLDGELHADVGGPVQPAAAHPAVPNSVQQILTCFSSGTSGQHSARGSPVSSGHAAASAHSSSPAQYQQAEPTISLKPYMHPPIERAPSVAQSPVTYPLQHQPAAGQQGMFALYQPVVTCVVRDSHGATTPSTSGMLSSPSCSSAAGRSGGAPHSHSSIHSRSHVGKPVIQGINQEPWTPAPPSSSWQQGGGHASAGGHSKPAGAGQGTPQAAGAQQQQQQGSAARSSGAGLPLTKANVMKMIDRGGRSGITGAGLAEQFGIRGFPHSPTSRQLQAHLQSLVEDMDIYRKPSPGSSPTSMATGHVDISDQGVCFAAM